MSLNLTRPRIAAIAATAFIAGVFFASSMDWTRILSAQGRTTGKSISTAAIQPLMDQQSAFVAIAEHVTPAVVSIEAQRDPRPVTQGQGGQRRLQVPPGFEEFFGDGSPQQQRQPQESSGSGFIVTADGYVLTNNHVVEGADRLTVSLTDRRSFKARIVGRDPQTDVAVLKIEGKDLPTVPLGDDAKVRIGEWAVAVGNPLGLDFTVTAGIISAKGRSTELRNLNSNTYAIQDFLQTDAAINPGNSGGPLVNIRGEVIGINSAIASGTGFYSGYGFAIPITLAKTVMDDIIAHGRVRRAIMGLGLNEVTAEDASVNKLKGIAGAKVGSVTDLPGGNPAEKAGIEIGDIITAVDGKPVDRVSTLQRAVRMHQPGEQVTLEGVRYGEKRTWKVRLAEAPGDEKTVASAPTKAKEDSELGTSVTATKLGITVQPLTPALLQANRISESLSGVLVKEVENGGPSSGSKLVAGDIITDVLFPDKAAIKTPADLQRALGKVKEGDIIGLKLSRLFTAQGGRQTAVANIRVGGQ